MKKTDHEMQSGLDRVRFAELLISQLPHTHEGRNTWLLNYGNMKDSERMRDINGIKFDTETMAAIPKDS